MKSVFTMPLAIAAVEEISRQQAHGDVLLHARRRFELPGGAFFHYMAAANTLGGFVATKQYTYVGGKLTFLVSLFSAETGEALALIEGDVLSQVRTGAASGVATKYLANRTADSVGMIGTGWQAGSQLEAIAAVRKLKSVKVYGRDSARREKFATEMSGRLGVTVGVVGSSEEATADVAIACAATTSSHPVMFGKNIAPGTHINAIGANHLRKRELDSETVAKSSLIIVDSIEQSKQEAGDLVQGFAGHEQRWDTVRELSSLVAGICAGRTSESQITLFKSNGIAAWDLAAAICVYRLAKEQRLGRTLSFWQ